MNIKKIIINQLMKIKVSHSLPGRIRLKVSSLKMVPEEYKVYEKFIGEALKKLKGVQTVNVNSVTGSILITYDTETLYEKKLLSWMDVIKQIGINNYDLIEKYGETNLDFVIKSIEQQLDDAINKL